MGIESWSSNPASNTTLDGTINIAVGTAPSNVGVFMRTIMADIYNQYLNAEWTNWNDAGITWISGTSFSTTADSTSHYFAGRRIRAVGSTTGVIVGTITSATFSGVTTVVVAWDTGSLANEALLISVSTVTVNSLPKTLAVWPAINTYYAVSALGSISSGTVTFNHSTADVFTLTVAGSQTWAFGGWPSAGNEAFSFIEVTNGGSATITLPTINWIKPDGSGQTTTTFPYTLQASGTDFLVIWSRDGGTTLYGKVVR